MNESVGVIVGRFQCAELTGGHLELIEFVKTQGHNQILIALGIAPNPCTKNNPLHYTARVAMMRESNPQFIYMPIHDDPSDPIWSENLDNIIKMAFPFTNNVTLYGSRDSFKDRYYGKFKVREFEPKTYDNATKSRENYGSRVGFNKDYRHGVIYGAYQKFDTCYQTVDVIVFTHLDFNPEKCSVIVGTKGIYGEKYMFPGGFVDPKMDKNLKDACIREVKEETNLTITNPVYVGSFMTEDYRYKYEEDKIMTHLHYDFVVNTDYLKASDDLKTIKIVPLTSTTIDNFIPTHKRMALEIIIKLDEINNKSAYTNQLINK
jgi:bifunctional NMN adenylyltransferase/nudix hydrolase